MLIYATHNYTTDSILGTRIKMLPCDKPVSNFISSSFVTIPIFFNETLAWGQQNKKDKTIH